MSDCNYNALHIHGGQYRAGACLPLSPSLQWSYEKTITLTTRRNKGGYRQTFRSNVDHSVQYYGVRIPKRFVLKALDMCTSRSIC